MLVLRYRTNVVVEEMDGLFSHGTVLVNLNLIEVTCVFNISLKDNGNDRCNEGHDHPKNSCFLPANPERFTNHSLALYL